MPSSLNAYHNSFYYLDLWNQPIREIFQAMRPLSLLIPIIYTLEISQYSRN